MPDSAPASKPKRVEILRRLYLAPEHRPGKAHHAEPGDVVDLPEDIADRCIAAGVAKAPEPAKPKRVRRARKPKEG